MTDDSLALGRSHGKGVATYAAFGLLVSPNTEVVYISFDIRLPMITVGIADNSSIPFGMYL